MDTVKTAAEGMKTHSSSVAVWMRNSVSPTLRNMLPASLGPPHVKPATSNSSVPVWTESKVCLLPVYINLIIIVNLDNLCLLQGVVSLKYSYTLILIIFLIQYKCIKLQCFLSGFLFFYCLIYQFCFQLIERPPGTLKNTFVVPSTSAEWKNVNKSGNKINSYQTTFWLLLYVFNITF